MWNCWEDTGNGRILGGLCRALQARGSVLLRWKCRLLLLKEKWVRACSGKQAVVALRVQWVGCSPGRIFRCAVAEGCEYEPKGVNIDCAAVGVSGLGVL